MIGKGAMELFSEASDKRLAIEKNVVARCMSIFGNF